MSIVHILTGYSVFCLAVPLFLIQPRLLGTYPLPPALTAGLGVLVYLFIGLLSLADLLETLIMLWRPIVTLASLMTLGFAAERLGVLAALARLAARGTAPCATTLFGRVFVLSVVSSILLNNDITIIMLTPLVVTLVRTRYPTRPDLLIPFAYVVFIAAGVAPLMISNPMNLVVASVAGITFNDYARMMFPVALSVWGLSFGILRLLYWRTLASVGPSDVQARPLTAVASPYWPMIVLVLGVVCAYPIASYFGYPVWLIALGGALAACVFLYRHARIKVTAVMGQGIAWETLLFLLGVVLVGVGLRNVGIVDHLTNLYHNQSLLAIGVVSAVGSAVMNNHPMAILNLLALGGEQANTSHILAALIGGDLGPRFLPIGSLAGLMWAALLRRHQTPISLLNFIRLGLLINIPTLLVALILLEKLT